MLVVPMHESDPVMIGLHLVGTHVISHYWSHDTLTQDDGGVVTGFHGYHTSVEDLLEC